MNVPVPALKEDTKFTTVKHLLVKNSERIAKALPAHISADHMIRVTLNALQGESKILSCTQESLFQAIIEASTYGWEIGGPLAEAYIIPYKTTATLIPGYRGLIALVKRGGKVKELIRSVVREGDEFSWGPLEDPPITHKPALTTNAITHVYCIAKFSDGTWGQPIVATTEQIDDHKRRYSQGWKMAESKDKDSPWHKSWEKMALKTMVRSYIMQGFAIADPGVIEMANRESIIEGNVIDSSIERITTDKPEPLSAPADVTDDFFSLCAFEAGGMTTDAIEQKRKDLLEAATTTQEADLAHDVCDRALQATENK